MPLDLFRDVLGAKVVKVRENNTVVEKVIYTAIGVDLDGNKFVLDYEKTDREDLDGWMRFLNGLISHRLGRVDVIVTDDFPGLDNLISTLFLSSSHQLCLVHFTRNLIRALPDDVAKRAMDLGRELKLTRNVEEGKAIFPSLSDLIGKYSAKRVKRLLDASNRHIAFLNFPREVRHYIYTNNTLESFNSLDAVQQDLGDFSSP